MAWHRRDVRAHAFAMAHPELTAWLARWAATGRRRWVWATRPVRACAATCRRWTRATGIRAGAAIGRWVRALRARGCRLIAGLSPVPREVLVDLDPPTVEIPLPVAAGSAHTNGDTQWQRPATTPVTSSTVGLRNTRPDADRAPPPGQTAVAARPLSLIHISEPTRPY